MTNLELLPRVIVGKTISQSRMLEEIEEWDETEARYNFSQVPKRYEGLTGNKLGGYAGLSLFTTFINLLRDQPDNHRYFTVLIQAQKQALHYHNAQFKEAND